MAATCFREIDANDKWYSASMTGYGIATPTTPTIIRAATDWELAGSWDGTPVATTVPFLNLDGYKRILIICRNIVLAASGVRRFEVSHDNGGSWHTTSGDYVSIGDDGQENAGTSLGVHDTATASARSGYALIDNWNTTGLKPIVISRASINRSGLLTPAFAMNALRISGTGGGNVNSGTIRIYGKR